MREREQEFNNWLAGHNASWQRIKRESQMAVIQRKYQPLFHEVEQSLRIAYQCETRVAAYRKFNELEHSFLSELIEAGYHEYRGALIRLDRRMQAQVSVSDSCNLNQGNGGVSFARASVAPGGSLIATTTPIRVFNDGGSDRGSVGAGGNFGSGATASVGYAGGEMDNRGGNFGGGSTAGAGFAGGDMDNNGGNFGGGSSASAGFAGGDMDNNGGNFSGGSTAGAGFAGGDMDNNGGNFGGGSTAGAGFAGGDMDNNGGNFGGGSSAGTGFGGGDMDNNGGNGGGLGDGSDSGGGFGGGGMDNSGGNDW